RLGNMKLELIVSTEIEEIENYKKKKIEEDRKIAQKTYSDKEKLEVSAKQNGTNKRIEIGYKIPEEPSFMEEIMEEENKMTVQGNIFKVTIRTLRSKRSLLIIKANDYTDYIEIKTLSINDDDALMLDKLKTGS